MDDVKRLLGILEERSGRFDRIDRWAGWDHDSPFRPAANQTSTTNREHKELGDRSISPWIRLVRQSLVQNLYIDGYRSDSDSDNARPWVLWQKSGMDRKQTQVFDAAVTYGFSFGVSQPDGDGGVLMRGVSPRRMVAEFDEVDDLTALTAVEVVTDGRLVRYYTPEVIQTISVSAGHFEVIEEMEHNAGVCPVVRYAPQMSLEGSAPGEVEPYISIAARINQSTYHRLTIERFGAFVAKYATGIEMPEDANDADRQKLKMAVDTMMMFENPDTRVGTLSGSPLDGVISSAEFDVLTLAAVSQTPAHEMVGKMANMSAEALAAAKASQDSKINLFQINLGEAAEQQLRHSSAIIGDTESAEDYSAQVHWRDTTPRSLGQLVDALGKAVTMLDLPSEMAREQLPFMTQQDLDRANAIAEEGGAMAAILADLANQSGVSTGGSGGSASDTKAQADAMGVLIRAGVEPSDAAARVGMPGTVFTGAIPTSLRVPQTEATKLEDG